MIEIDRLYPFQKWDKYGFIYGVAIKNGKIYNRPDSKKDRDWAEIKLEYEYDNIWTLVYLPVMEPIYEICSFNFPLTKKDREYMISNILLQKYKHILTQKKK